MASCANDHTEDIQSPSIPLDYDSPISLGGDAQEGYSRAWYDLTKLTLTEAAHGYFGVYAAYTGTERFDDTSTEVCGADNFLHNHKFVPNNILDTTTGDVDYWRGDPDAYWPLMSTDYVSFFAYAPYTGNRQISDLDIDPECQGALKFNFTPNSDCTLQYDLCVSKAIIDITKAQAKSGTDQRCSGTHMKFDFKHTLAKIKFYGKYDGNIDGFAKNIRISEITLKKLVGTNQLTYDIDPTSDEVFSWAEIPNPIPDSQIMDFTALPDGAISLDKTDYKDVTYQKGYLFMLPQEIPDNASMDLLFTFFDDSGKIVTSIRRNYPLKLTNGTTWVAGNEYHYNIMVDVKDLSYIDAVVNVEEFSQSYNKADEVDYK